MTSRTFSLANDAQALQLLHSELTLQGIGPDLSIEQLESVFAGQGWLALDDGHCVGGAAIVLADSASEGDLIWMTLPGTADQVRASLLEVVLVRAHEMQANSLLCYLSEADTENLSFMASEACPAEAVAGYSRWVNHFGEVVEVAVPDGTNVYVADDAHLLLQATQVVWGDLPGHKPATLDAVGEAIEAFGTANQFLLLDESGSPVGLVRGLMISENEAYIDAPGLAPGWRQPENYAFLLAHVMNHMADLGAQTAVMESWGDPPAAADGFHAVGWVQQAFLPAWRITVS